MTSAAPPALSTAIALSRTAADPRTLRVVVQRREGELEERKGDSLDAEVGDVINIKDVCLEVTKCMDKQIPAIVVYLDPWKKSLDSIIILKQLIEQIYNTIIESSNTSDNTSNQRSSEEEKEEEEEEEEYFVPIAMAAKLIQGQEHIDILTNQQVETRMGLEDLLHVFCPTLDGAKQLEKEIENRTQKREQEDEKNKILLIHICYCQQDEDKWLTYPVTLLYIWDMNENEMISVAEMCKEMKLIMEGNKTRFSDACLLGTGDNPGNITRILRRYLVKGECFLIYNTEQGSTEINENQLVSDLLSANKVTYSVTYTPQEIKYLTRLKDDHDDNNNNNKQLSVCHNTQETHETTDKSETGFEKTEETEEKEEEEREKQERNISQENDETQSTREELVMKHSIKEENTNTKSVPLPYNSYSDDIDINIKDTNLNDKVDKSKQNNNNIFEVIDNYQESLPKINRNDAEKNNNININEEQVIQQNSYNDYNIESVSRETYEEAIEQLKQSEQLRYMLENNYKNVIENIEMPINDDLLQEEIQIEMQIERLLNLCKVFNLNTHKGQNDEENSGNENENMTNLTQQENIPFYDLTALNNYISEQSSTITSLNEQLIHQRFKNAEIMLEALQLGINPSFQYEDINDMRIDNSNHLVRLHKILLENLVLELSELKSAQRELLKSRMDILIYDQSTKSLGLGTTGSTHSKIKHSIVLTEYDYNSIGKNRNKNNISSSINMKRNNNNNDYYSNDYNGETEGNYNTNIIKKGNKNIKSGKIKHKKSLANSHVVKSLEEKCNDIYAIDMQITDMKQKMVEIDKIIAENNKKIPLIAEERNKMTGEINEYNNIASDIYKLVHLFNEKIDKYQEYFGTDIVDQLTLTRDISTKNKIDSILEETSEKINSLNANFHLLSPQEKRLLKELIPLFETIVHLTKSITSSPRTKIIAKRQEAVIDMIKLSEILSQWLENLIV